VGGGGSEQQRSCKKTGSFLSFPYVCPEPVLVKGAFYICKWLKKTRFAAALAETASDDGGGGGGGGENRSCASMGARAKKRQKTQKIHSITSGLCEI
jgi:hypothetical protein